MASSNKRRDHDIMKLRMADYDVSFIDEKRPWEFFVKFKGPKESKWGAVCCRRKHEASNIALHYLCVA